MVRRARNARSVTGEGRDRASGRYTHTAEAVCRCGHELGRHAAACVDGVRECFVDGCDCERFELPALRAVRNLDGRPITDAVRELVNAAVHEAGPGIALAAALAEGASKIAAAKLAERAADDAIAENSRTLDALVELVSPGAVMDDAQLIEAVRELVSLREVLRAEEKRAADGLCYACDAAAVGYLQRADGRMFRACGRHATPELAALLAPPQLAPAPAAPDDLGWFLVGKRLVRVTEVIDGSERTDDENREHLEQLRARRRTALDIPERFSAMPEPRGGFHRSPDGGRR